MSSESLFGSRTQADILTGLDLANGNPLSGSTIARLFGLNLQSTYRCISRLRDLGVVEEISKGSGKQRLYRLTKNDLTKQVVDVVRALRRNRLAQSDILQSLSESLRLGRYYVSLPLALRITYDVFYAPNYLLIVADDDETVANVETATTKFRDIRIISKQSSLRGRQFYFDKSLGITLASTEQAMADGLNWYSEIRDPELVRVLLATPYRVDLSRVVRLLSDLGRKRAYEIFDRRRVVYGESPSFTRLEPMKKKVDPLVEDLNKEWRAVLLPNR